MPIKRIVAATAGVVTLIAGIGCAYGCPDASCSGGFGGAGTDGGAGEGGMKSTSVTTGVGGFGGSSTGGAGGAPSDAGTD